MRFGANKLHKITTIFHGSLYQKHQVTIFYIQCCYNLCDWWYFTSMHKKYCKKHSCNHESSKLRFSFPGLARSFPMATHNFTISQIGSNKQEIYSSFNFQFFSQLKEKCWLSCWMFSQKWEVSVILNQRAIFRPSMLIVTALCALLNFFFSANALTCLSYRVGAFFPELCNDKCKLFVNLRGI